MYGNISLCLQKPSVFYLITMSNYVVHTTTGPGAFGVKENCKEFVAKDHKSGKVSASAKGEPCCKTHLRSHPMLGLQKLQVAKHMPTAQFIELLSPPVLQFCQQKGMYGKVSCLQMTDIL